MRAAMLLLACMFALPAHALPRFAARNGAPCAMCHVNPTGGGMRNQYGRNVYAKHVLPMLVKGEVADPGFNPEWAPSDEHSVAVGADMRLAYLLVDTQYRTDPATGDTRFRLPPINTLFLMQTDVYGAAQLTDTFTFYIDYGIASGNLEAFGLVNPGWANMWIKAGSFLPAYGLKLANHRTYIREEGLGLEPNFRDTGVEVGINPGRHTVVLGMFNGANGQAGLNPDRQFGMSGRADATASLGALNITAGGSAWFEPGGAKAIDADDPDETTLETKFGGYVMASAGRLTYLGEYDVRRNISAGGKEGETTCGTDFDVDDYNPAVRCSAVAYNELDVLVAQGVDINLIYEMYDPDTRLSPNTLARIGGGVELFPSAHTEIKLLFRHTLGDVETADDDPRTFFTAASSGMNEFIAFAHFFL
jgi:hypothetical protein